MPRISLTITDEMHDAIQILAEKSKVKFNSQIESMLGTHLYLAELNKNAQLCTDMNNVAQNGTSAEKIQGSSSSVTVADEHKILQTDSEEDADLEILLLNREDILSTIKYIGDAEDPTDAFRILKSEGNTFSQCQKILKTEYNRGGAALVIEESDIGRDNL